MFLQQNLTACVPSSGPRLTVGDEICGHTIDEELSRDGGVTVFKVISGCGRILVAKVFDHDDSFEQESRALFGVKHVCASSRSVIRAEGVCAHVELSSTDFGPVIYGVVLMDYHPLGTLKAYMRENELSRQNSVDIVVQVLGALDILAQAGVIHADINPRNLLVRQNSGKFGVVLFDFDLSMQCLPAKGKAKVALVKTDYNGTPGYIAPEVLTLRGARHETDVWSAFAMFFELFTGKQLFDIFGDFKTAYVGGGDTFVFEYVPDSPNKRQEIAAQVKLIDHVRECGIRRIIEFNGAKCSCDADHCAEFLNFGLVHEVNNRPNARDCLDKFRCSRVFIN